MKNLALCAFREHFDVLYSTLTSQPELILGLASKLYKRLLISEDTRHAIQQTAGIVSPVYQASRLLLAIESAIEMNPRILRQLLRILRKESKSVAEALQKRYSK